MVSLKLYAAIYVVLFASATAQVGVEFANLSYWVAATIIIVLSFVKAGLVAGYYQHLRFEPRSLTYLMLMALGVVVALVSAATYSMA
ncbi:MAG: cytochrome C oxidase subunit IV family protein [Halodesulfurarchaeum sp.]